MKTTSSLLQEYRTYFTFLREIPDKIYYLLQPEEWIFPNADVQKIKSNLEESLDVYIMTYKKNIFLRSIPLQSHLCAWLEVAQLTDNQLKIISQAEDIISMKNINFIAYKKPLCIQEPEKSILAKFYR